jgi:hypothetical protein
LPLAEAVVTRQTAKVVDKAMTAAARRNDVLIFDAHEFWTPWLASHIGDNVLL